VLAPIDFPRIEAALQSRAGWIELVIIAISFAIGWTLDRHVRLKSTSGAGVVRLSLGSVNRLLLPLVTLALLVIALVVYQRWQPPFFLSIAVPLMIALAVIRLIVYAMREVFGAPGWLPFSERMVSFAIWGVVLLHFLGVLPELRADLEALVIPVGAKHLSMLDLLKGIVVVVLTIAACLWLSGLVEQRLAKAKTVDTSVRVVISKAVRALMLAFGVLIALQAVGIDLTLLTVFGGALGVGIGLGLQKLASNYIAGFTILLDRSIRLGDVITVDNRMGVVAKLTSRYVIVRSLDGVEAVVPNETLVTTTVLNHSYTNREVRVAVPVQVAYDSDVELALELMAAAGNAEPRVLKTGPNAPAAQITRFTDLGIELELGVWINDPENGAGGVRNAINQRIWTAFRANGIKIASPQREFRLTGLAERPADGVSTPVQAGPAAQLPKTG
jgi:small-conductance mechanosensitive channel